jgi:simple sugar transport system ATP-binding protein
MPLLALENLDKHYGAVHAVRDVSLAFEAGRLHVVAGENGAGKSTLLKMAAGVVVPDRGRVLVDGALLTPHTAREAIARKVAMVQQHFALVPVLSALDNVMLGAEPMRSFGRLDRKAALAKAEQVAADIGVTLDWSEPVARMGVGQRQRLEIVRTLVRDARVVILDEPTAVLTPGEATALYATLRKMTGAGRAVVVVTHRIDEVREHADEVSVMRQGRLVSTRAVTTRDEATLAAITRDIMGEEGAEAPARPAASAGEVVLEVEDLALGTALRGATLSVRAGEIVGIAGVEGNGQRQLVEVLAGLAKPEAGEVRGGPVACVHEDRGAEGLVAAASVRDNLVLGELSRFTSRLGWLDLPAIEAEARKRMEGANVVPADLDAPVGALSGGNQQKVVVARAVARAERVKAIVFAQPTRGVDPVASRAIWREIVRMAASGRGVLVVSADLAELHALAHRILVMARGRIVAELAPDAPDAVIGEAMLGGTSEASRA